MFRDERKILYVVLSMKISRPDLSRLSIRTVNPPLFDLSEGVSGGKNSGAVTLTGRHARADTIGFPQKGEGKNSDVASRETRRS